MMITGVKIGMVGLLICIILILGGLFFYGILYVIQKIDKHIKSENEKQTWYYNYEYKRLFHRKK